MRTSCKIQLVFILIFVTCNKYSVSGYNYAVIARIQRAKKYCLKFIVVINKL